MSDIKTTRDACRKFAEDNLCECCIELAEWQDTAILRYGLVRELAGMCNAFISNHDGLRMAESLINRAAVDAASKEPSGDTERLDFVMRHEAWIAWSKDGESCRLFHRDEDGEPMPMLGWGARHWSHNPREAIDAAIAATKAAK